MGASFRVDWRGDNVARAMRAASKRGIDDTMAAATIEAKSNHPGWRNRTGTAEGSIKIITPAQEKGDGVEGQWGSQAVNYMIWLEILRGAALRSAADVQYPTLVSRIAQQMGRAA